MSKFHINFFQTTEGEGIRWQRVWIAGVIVVVVIGAGLTGLVAYGKTFDARVVPRVTLNNVSLGGMSGDELREYLNTMNDKLIREGVIVMATIDGQQKSFRIQSPMVAGDTLVPLVTFDVDVEVSRLLTYKKSTNSIMQAVQIVTNRLNGVEWHLSSVQLTDAVLFNEITEVLTPYETQPVSAALKVTAYPPEEELAYTITTSSPGMVFSYANLEKAVVSAWSDLRQPIIQLETIIAPPDVSEDELRAVADQLPSIFGKGPMVLTYTDSHTKEDYTWKITEKQMGAWVDVVQDDTSGYMLTLNTSSTESYLREEVEADIGVEAQNAKFDIGSGGKVVEFTGSRPGVGVDMPVTIENILSSFETRKTSTSALPNIAVAVKEVEPDISTGDVNDLGITEVLGTGTSNFSGSPVNRIANIKNAVMNKLHGSLIKPGEEFSLNNALRPYTIENGYLPEKVIVGNRIKPEVGGGLCQVGTTMFRAAMNSGLDITDRTNHGLIVSYYNDPSNGNPGTDATIYDGWPDLKFINDTGHHVLITASMNTKTGDLRFTLWGTNDGRKGYYTPPKAYNWVSPGPYKEIVTADLPPGKKECQHAYKGADASFTYIRAMPSGEKLEKVYTSHYRAVPETCYVGKSNEVATPAPGTTCTDGDDCTPAPTPEETPIDPVSDSGLPVLEPSTPSSESVEATG